ncbi:hypothetical protein BQ8482_480092 [Mesorhizobium delmotii]|uniref:Uncharacterized protein n=1 Tax=Mesorhizobium delmotii TaxID=1631247 RepID=A0A2P9ATZ1_9HYPH|nr:hypothetical protein BQ8482_480092 [Mesorhizobium delmotii]
MPEHKSGEGSRFTSRYGVQRSGLVRRTFRHSRRHPAREVAEALAAPMEHRPDRDDQSGVIRAFSRNRVVAFGSGPPEHCRRVTAWIPGSAPRRFAPCSALGRSGGVFAAQRQRRASKIRFFDGRRWLDGLWLASEKDWPADVAELVDARDLKSALSHPDMSRRVLDSPVFRPFPGPVALSSPLVTACA